MYSFQAILFLTLATLVLADHPVHKPAPVYHPAPVVHKPAPVYHPAPVVHKPAPTYHEPAPAYHEPAYKDTPAHYNYGYAVKDDYAGLHFGADESRDGYATNGQYHVLLPDGRTQTVTYTVGDGYSGYVADVQYSGYAKEYKPAPTYKPAPVYKPRYHA